MATETQLHAIPLWLLREYLVETGGQDAAEDLVVGDGWQAKLEKQPPRQIGSLKVGIVKITLEGSSAALGEVLPQLEKKTMRAGAKEMGIDKSLWAEVDEQGKLVIAPEVAERYGLKPGARVRLDEDDNSIRLHRPVTHLAKLYVEPTNFCNIDCVTCMRSNWSVEIGRMSSPTFDRIVEELETLSTRPTVFFGGIGEPLPHSHLPQMIERVKSLGCRVEMITNGTLLSEEKGRAIIDAGLDLLWVSIDGARPESYADVRLGAELPVVIENLKKT